MMTIEEILAGESKNVEFKENLPEKSIKSLQEKGILVQSGTKRKANWIIIR